MMLHRVERLLLDLAVCAIFGLGLLITLSVMSRGLFNSGIPDTVVLVRELMVAAILLPLAAATANRAHIAVEFLANMLPPRTQVWMIVFGSLIGLLALMPLLYAGWREAAKTLSNGSFYFGDLNVPKWPGRVLFLLGLSFCWVRLFIMFISDLKAAIEGRLVDGVHLRSKQMDNH
ncbi:TRAP transporter small permease [Roseibium algae]|uniref:TRAP transporter small permease protein n=1 Tax=Roseibium algae TaxID=3123038 RepID=A0ABU8TM81_9HYPH